MPTVIPTATIADASATPLDVGQFTKIYRELLPDLSRYARSLARNPDLADDLVQDATIRAWRSRDSFLAGSNFKAWVYRILRNCFLSRVRHDRIARTESYGLNMPEVAVASNQEAPIFLQDVERYWDRLSLAQRRAIELTGIEGRSYEEAAAIEQVAIGTLKSRAARGRQALLALLDADVPEAAGSAASAAFQSIPPIASLEADRPTDDADRTQIDKLRAWRTARIDLAPVA